MGGRSMTFKKRNRSDLQNVHAVGAFVNKWVKNGGIGERPKGWLTGHQHKRTLMYTGKKCQGMYSVR